MSAVLEVQEDNATRAVAPQRIMRQKSRRYPLAINVARYDGQRGHWRSLNVSEGGCFVTGEPLLALSDELEIGLWLGNGQDELITRARVAWINNAEKPRASNLPVGMGLQFIDLDEAGRTALKRQLEASEKTPEKDGGEKGTKAKDDNLPAGTVLGAYRIIKPLGAGGMGCVYLAEHQALGRKVALKTLHARFAHDETIVRRFFDEARAVNKINHENIIEITDFVSQGAINYFVMEFLQGRNLAEVQAQDGHLPLLRVLDIAAQLAGALAAAHDAGITHRDLKPDNVLLIDKPGRKDVVKLLDFGIAKLTQDGVSMSQTATGLLLGTPGYIAPEQILGGKADHRSDIYAFGVLLYQMVTGKKPFVADTWPQLLMKHTTEPAPMPRVEGQLIPGPLIDVLMRCLEKNPDERPQSMHEINVTLTAVADGIKSGVPLVPPSLPRPDQTVAIPSPFAAALQETLEPDPPHQPRRSKLPLALTSIAFVAALCVAAILLLRPEPPATVVTNAQASVAATPQTQATTSEPVASPTQAPAATVSTNTKLTTPSAVDAKPEPPLKTADKPRRDKDREKERDSKPQVAAGGGGGASQVAFQLDIAGQLLSQKDFTQALRVLESLVKIAPQNPLVHRSLGIAYTGSGQKPQACREFKRYLELAPNAGDRARVETLVGGCP